MFIERLSKKELSQLCKALINSESTVIKSFDELEKVDTENMTAFRTKNYEPFSHYIEFDDFSASYDVADVTSFPSFRNSADKTSILRNALFEIFGEEYLAELRNYWENQKNIKVKELKNTINEENKIVEDILENFKKDLERFPTTEEKVEYLKSFGFKVNAKKDDENLEK